MTQPLPKTWWEGTVQRGDGRGSALGFPTANIQLATTTPPVPEGIFAGWTQLQPDLTWLPTVIHSGPRPTFAGSLPSIELHLLDFEARDLYDQTVRFQLIEHIRDIESFDSIEKLIAAIEADCVAARKILIQL